jgi:TrmH family RNA methyltransferase
MTEAVITSLTNPRVKSAVRLRDRREREETGLTLVDGAREILRALDSGVEVERVFIAPDVVRSADAVAVMDRLVGDRRSSEVSAAVVAKLAFGDRSDGVVAVIRPRRTTLEDVKLGRNPLLLVVEGVEKPGNLGAVLRSADAAGADAVIAAEPRTDVWNPNAIRASLGTIFAVPVVAASAVDTRAWLMARDVRVVTTVVDAPTTYTEADLRGPLAIVVGSEAEGLTSSWRGEGLAPISIPMHGIADSLNVSIAAAVVLFEALRQRTVTLDRGD